MKNIKELSKPGKTSKPNKEKVNAKPDVTFDKFRPHEEDIRHKALDLYHSRIERGDFGTPEEDWLEAEEYLKNNEA
jgi:hypothetical protein